MADVSVISAAGGETIQLGPVQMRMLEDGRTTGHRLGVGEITIAAHADGPPQHRHAQHDEGFYVVSGTARFTVADTTYDASAGTFVMIPPGAPHTFANPADEPAVLLNTFTPDLVRAVLPGPAGHDRCRPAPDTGQQRRGYEPVRDNPSHRLRRGDPMTTIRTVALPDTGPVDVTVSEYGDGQPFLLLHGGGGSDTVTGFAELFAKTHHVRVIVPTHPGFGGTDRPPALTSIPDLATLYAALIDQLEADDVTVIGNSIGGWITAEMALLASPRIGGAVLVDAVGIEVPGHPIADFFSLTMDEVFTLSFHDPEPFRIDPATLPPAAQSIAAGNRAALATYAGTAMSDSTLAGRLAHVELATLVLWGDSDRIADPDYGRAYAGAIPRARFQLLPDTGHMPQLESPEQLMNAIWSNANTFSGQPISRRS